MGREPVNPYGGTAHWDSPQPIFLSLGIFQGLLELTFCVHASEVSGWTETEALSVPLSL